MKDIIIETLEAKLKGLQLEKKELEDKLYHSHYSDISDYISFLNKETNLDIKLSYVKKIKDALKLADKQSRNYEKWFEKLLKTNLEINKLSGELSLQKLKRG